MTRALWISLVIILLSFSDAAATDYYVRQTVGNDANDGVSPQTAWEHMIKLPKAMHAGDTAYVGPGLYREEIAVWNDGTAEARVTFIADTTGLHTGDPPGVVMMTGAEPVDENIFVQSSAPGVYMAPFRDFAVLGMTEMDGDQFRYARAQHTQEFLGKKMTELEVVAKLPSCFFHDDATKTLYVHTSDGRPPSTHEIELFRRGNGITMTGKHYMTIIGFTFRHMGDAGISFWHGSSNGIAMYNTSYGNRQGIRVYDASDILLYDNTLFRNENCGVYYAARSTNGVNIGNTAYENIKGIRWSTQSNDGMAVDNVLFDNLERGISVENVTHTVLQGNRILNNRSSQLLIVPTEYTSDDNCFANGQPDQLLVDFFFGERYKTLAEYQRAKHQDMHSHEGDCGPLPAKLDVHQLHRDTMSYRERARALLRGATPHRGEGQTHGAEPAEQPKGWFEKLFGR